MTLALSRRSDPAAVAQEWREIRTSGAALAGVRTRRGRDVVWDGAVRGVVRGGVVCWLSG
jgi:hypothetical protein